MTLLLSVLYGGVAIKYRYKIWGTVIDNKNLPSPRSKLLPSETYVSCEHGNIDKFIYRKCRHVRPHSQNGFSFIFQCGIRVYSLQKPE